MTKCKGMYIYRVAGKDFCTLCGEPMGASGCDGGSWVHIDTRPDRIVSTSYWKGQRVRVVLANGVIWTAKPGRTL